GRFQRFVVIQSHKKVMYEKVCVSVLGYSKLKAYVRPNNNINASEILCTQFKDVLAAEGVGTRCMERNRSIIKIWLLFLLQNTINTITRRVSIETLTKKLAINNKIGRASWRHRV